MGPGSLAALGPGTTSMRAACSRQPALAAFIMLTFAERFALALGDAQVEFLDVLVLAQRRRLAVEHDATALQDIAVARVAQRHVGVLLGEQERHALVLIEAFDDPENLLHDLRRKPHRGLV